MKMLKFRVWDTKRKRLVYPKQIFISEDICKFVHGGSLRIVAREDCVIEQFTGLLDREGKEIWEGDLIYPWSESKLSIVRYLDGKFIPTYFYEDGSILCEGWGLNLCGTVKGNIHEHPKFLKKVPVATKESVDKAFRGFLH